jgi:Zn-dependent alcohol dehydrogenase
LNGSDAVSPAENQIAAISTDALALMTVAQLAAMSETQIGSLTGDGQIAALTGAQIYGLKDTGINGLTTAQMALFTVAQIEPADDNASTGFKAAQLAGMTDEQLGAFSADAKTSILANAAQIASLTTAQKTALGWTAPT